MRFVFGRRWPSHSFYLARCADLQRSLCAEPPARFSKQTRTKCVRRGNNNRDVLGHGVTQFEAPRLDDREITFPAKLIQERGAKEYK